MRAMNKQRPTEAEFAELKRKSDAAFQASIERMCAELGWDPKDTAVHRSHNTGCYCACPDGPCQHEWSGWVELENGGSTVCSRCGTTTMSHDMRCGP